MKALSEKVSQNSIDLDLICYTIHPFDVFNLAETILTVFFYIDVIYVYS
jgi:hypothetical protein